MGVPIIGLVENMATYVCPHCDKEGKLFAGDDVQKLTERKEIPYIGKIPFDTRVSQSKSGNLFYKEFKVAAKRNKYLGQWASQKLGYNPEQEKFYNNEPR